MASCRALYVTPYVAQNERRPGDLALDLQHHQLAVTCSQPTSKVSGVEEIFGLIADYAEIFTAQALSRR